jgi:hypothetical protein
MFYALNIHIKQYHMRVTLKNLRRIKYHTINDLHIKQYYKLLNVVFKTSRGVLCSRGLYAFLLLFISNSRNFIKKKKKKERENNKETPSTQDVC